MVELMVCQCFENQYKKYCNGIQHLLQQTLYKHQGEQNIAQKTGSFTPHTLAVLQAAYSRTQVLSVAETAIIAKAAGITPHQVRTWFQNKRNRGSKRSTSTSEPTATSNRPIQGLPKRAQQQQVKLEPSPNIINNPSSGRRQVRGLPRRAQASHNAPTTSIIDSSLGNFPHHEDGSLPVGYGLPNQIYNCGERINRSPSLASTASNTTDVPNGGFVSPFDMQNIPQIAVEWGQGVLNVPVEALEGGQMPVFNFTPPSPLNMNFNQTFNPSSFQQNQQQNNLFDGQVYDTPIEEMQFNPFMGMGEQSNLDLAAGLESIESMLTSALSDPSSFEQFSTLAASPQISLDSLSPRSDTLDSIPSSIASTSNVGSPGWSGQINQNGEEGLDGGFFEALNGLLATSCNNNNQSVEIFGSPFDGYLNTPSRSVSMSSQDSYHGNGIISATDGIDLSYIAGIPLPPSPNTSSFALPTFDDNDISSFDLPAPLTDFSTGHFDNSHEFINQPSGMCTPSSTTSSGYPLVTPTTNTDTPLVELDQSQWSWISGALPYDMVGMEVEMTEYPNNDKIQNEGNWLMGQSIQMMAA
ncbi:uncharacterized protein L201_003811 [Kwoniella dendrophila CBS 6074]|uniref:Homeobox domain-containing protein n=1 Tax=Kwoniella dendrophila CBS 6074 TaxID=1295534 RepID=A0AAX4JUN6_9TREE